MQIRPGPIRAGYRNSDPMSLLEHPRCRTKIEDEFRDIAPLKNPLNIVSILVSMVRKAWNHLRAGIKGAFCRLRLHAFYLSIFRT